MASVSQQQALARFKIIPSALQDIIFSFQTAEVIRRIAEQNHLPQEKIPGVAETTGFVLLGFLHPEEAAREIQERSGIDMQIAKTIADAIDSRLFRPIRGELDRLYAPAPHEGEAPTMIHEVKKPDAGERVVRLDSLRVESGAPSAAPKSPSASMPMPPAPTIPPGPTGGPPPLIIHQESTAEPMKKVPSMGFGASNQLDTIKTETKIPPRPARLEIGGMWPPKAPAEKPFVPPPRPAPTMLSGQAGGPPRAIHYGQFRTPIEEKNIVPPPVVPPASSEKPSIPQQPQKPAPPTPTVSSGPPNLPVVPAAPPKTLIIEEVPKQKSIPPQGIMPQAKPQSPAFLPKPNIEQVATGSPAQKSAPSRALPKPPSPPAPTVSSGPAPTVPPRPVPTVPSGPPPRAAETQIPKSSPAPIGTISPNTRSVAPPPASSEKNPIVPPPQREPVIDLDTLKERAGG